MDVETGKVAPFDNVVAAKVAVGVLSVYEKVIALIAFTPQYNPT